MNDLIEKRIQSLRNILASDPDGILSGEINASCSAPRSGVEIWDHFLTLANGGRFGAIDLWSAAEIPENQFYLYDAFKPEDWLIIGQLIYQPLGLSRADGIVVLFRDDGTTHYYGSADDFLLECVLGKRYAEIVPNSEDDEWWQKLRSLGFDN